MSDDAAEGLALYESSDTDGAGDAPEPVDSTGQDAGWWITHPDGKAVKKAVLDRWKQSDRYEAKRAAKERANELRRAGHRGVQVVEDAEQDTATIRYSFGATETAKAPTKADQLIRRVVATLTVDPPAPDVQPNSDDDAEREAAQFAERVLKVEGGMAKRNDVGFLREALDLAGTYGSVFALTTWHPQAAGLQPLAIEAHRDAQTVDDALVQTVGTDEQGQPITVPVDPSQLTTRYVRVDQSLTDSPGEAQQVWQGDYVRTMMRPSQVRILPATATTIEAAQGAIVGRVLPLGEFLAECYDGERPDEEVVKKLVSWRPDGWRQWVPRAIRDSLDGDTPMRPDKTIADDAWVCTLTLYFRSCAEAPLGAKVLVTGDDEPKREPTKVTLGEGAASRTDVLPLPLAWLRWAEDTATGDPKGMSAIEVLAPHEEIRAKALGYLLSYMHRFGSPRTYIPMDSTMQPGDWEQGGDVPIRILPGAQPFFEQAPPLSAVVPTMYEDQGTEMDTASGLKEAAQGVSGGGVKSGVHAQQIIEQALVAIAGTQQNAHAFVCRLWRNELAFLRAYQTVPRQLASLGEAGDVQVRAFTGVDLQGAGDINIARGTGTLMPRSAKTALAREELQMAMQTGDTLGALRYQKQITGNTSPLLGAQDDPHRARITRQIALWKDAAKQQHEPPPQGEPTVTGVDEMGQPIIEPVPDPVAQQAAAIFAPNPTDDLPMVAPTRFAALSDAVASRVFLTADPRYQQALVAEYERARQSAGVMTRAEQMQQQQEQQQMQQAMQMEQLQSKNTQQAAQTAYAEKEGGPAASRMAMQNAVNEQIGQPQPQDYE